MNPDLITRLLALPSLREQAERDARELYEVSGGNWDTATHLAWGEPMRLIGFCATLLADLARWQSQAWALLEIARIKEWNTEGNVPLFFRADMDGRPLWVMRTKEGAAYFFDDEYPHTDANDRVAALAAILLHLSEGK